MLSHHSVGRDDDDLRGDFVLAEATCEGDTATRRYGFFLYFAM